jgi:hypothetical protein
MMSHTKHNGKQTHCRSQDLCDALRMHAPATFPPAHLCPHQALSSCPDLSGSLDSQATCPRLTRKSGSRLNLSSNLENHRSITLLGSTSVSPELPELNDSMYLHHGNCCCLQKQHHPMQLAASKHKMQVATAPLV